MFESAVHIKPKTIQSRFYTSSSNLQKQKNFLKKTYYEILLKLCFNILIMTTLYFMSIIPQRSVLFLLIQLSISITLYCHRLIYDNVKIIAMFITPLDKLVYVAVVYQILVENSYVQNYYLPLVNVVAIIVAVLMMANYVMVKRIYSIPADNHNHHNINNNHNDNNRHIMDRQMSNSVIDTLYGLAYRYINRARCIIRYIDYFIYLNIFIILSLCTLIVLTSSNPYQLLSYLFTFPLLLQSLLIFILLDIFTFSLTYFNQTYMFVSIKQKINSVPVVVSLLKLKDAADGQVIIYYI